MWREIIVATLAMEGPFSVAVHMPKRSGDLWDMARDHFGSFTEMKSYSSVRGVIDAVHSQKKTVGVLTYPRPGADDKDPWWRHLMLESAEAPKVVARLPFAGPGNIRDKTAEALVVCPVPQEPTGRDRSLIAMELMPEASRDGIDAAMERARIKTTFQSRHADADNRDIWRYLVEVEGFVKPRDGRLGKLAGDLDEQLIRLVNIGGYATPLTPEDLDGPDPRANEDRAHELAGGRQFGDFGHRAVCWWWIVGRGGGDGGQVFEQRGRLGPSRSGGGLAPLAGYFPLPRRRGDAASCGHPRSGVHDRGSRPHEALAWQATAACAWPAVASASPSARKRKRPPDRRRGCVSEPELMIADGLNLSGASA